MPSREDDQFYYVKPSDDGVIFPCPRCGGPATKAMYMGIPLKLCGDTKDCCYCWGAMDFLMLYLPFNGMFIRYRSYWPALWTFLTGRLEEDA